ncbi:MAG: hypothetical protein ACTSYC_00430 [Promethearchaeota archaeon]
MFSSYIDQNLIQEVFNSNEFKGWLLSKRWFGDKSLLSTLNFEVKIQYFQILKRILFITNIEIHRSGYSKFYFLPLIFYEKQVQEILDPEEQSTENIIKLTSNTFSKKIIITIENKQEIITLNLVEAEFCLYFWKKILFDKDISELFPDYDLELSLYLEQFEDPMNMRKVQDLIEASLYPNRYALSISQLGKGNTTNLVFQLDIINKKKKENNLSSFILKSYKKYTENVETSTLFLLVRNKFPYAPKIYGKLRVQNKDSIGILEKVDNDGNIGEIYWNELNSLIYNVFKNVNEEYSYLKNDNECSELTKQYCIETIKVSKEMGAYIKQLHEALKEPNIKDNQEYRIASKSFFDAYSRKLNTMITDLQENMEKESKSSYYNLPKIISLLIDTQDLIDRFQHDYDSETIYVQKIHQDLHMEQILYKKKNNAYEFYFIDFEGDPQLAIDEKKEKFPIEKDLASIFRALSYIKFNTLLLFIEKQMISKGKYEVPEEILYRMFFRKAAKPASKLLDPILYVLNYWEGKMMKEILKTYPCDLVLLNYFSIERVLHEINYEILYRPNKSIVPILGLKEILDKN